ncbi:MAG: DUF447 domain-containing protein [Candidatus Alkanophagales archaeon]
MRLRLSEIFEGRISEVIATTKSRDGRANAAPLGIIRENGYRVRIFRSRTLENVRQTGMLAANVTDDPVLFVMTALGDLEPQHFSRFRGFPVLRAADAWVLFKCSVSGETPEFSEFRLKPVALKVRRRGVRAVNRGRNAVVEAAIHATRYVLTEGVEREELKKLIDYYSKIVERCGGAAEREAMRLLYEKIAPVW